MGIPAIEGLNTTRIEEYSGCILKTDTMLAQIRCSLAEYHHFYFVDYTEMMLLLQVMFLFINLIFII